MATFTVSATNARVYGSTNGGASFTQITTGTTIQANSTYTFKVVPVNTNYKNPRLSHSGGGTGWAATSEGYDTSYYTAGFGLIPANTTLTVSATEKTKYTLGVYASPTAGGTVTGGGTYYEGTSVTCTATAKSGYRFTKWSSGETTPSITVTVNSTMSRTAYFEQYTYTVTYNANGGSNPPAKMTYGPTGETSHTFTLSGSATRAGFNFGGWMASATSGTVITTIQCTWNFQNKTVYAKWNRTTPTVTVTSADGNKGSITYDGSTQTSHSVTVDSDSTFDANNTTNVLYIYTGQTTRSFAPSAKAGYYFTGWSPSGTGIIGTSNRTFTANFAGKEITITYYYNDTSVTQKYTYTGGNIQLSVFKPTKSGYTFKGWATSSTGSPVYQPGQTVSQWSSNVSLYAVFKRNINKFYWGGVSDVNDNTIIYQGAPITNLTATMWNSFNNRIVALGQLEGQSWPDYPGKSSGDAITASDFNLARNRINLLSGRGTLPKVMSTGEEIKASYFNGEGSLKKALNDAIDWWMNN